MMHGDGTLTMVAILMSYNAGDVQHTNNGSYIDVI